ncbi:MAG TPA: hypothetical protein VIF32_03920 [Gemmatimonadaceae bacterium]
MIVIILSALAIIGALFAPRFVRPDAYATRLDRVEAGVRRFGPIVAAVLSIGIVWFVWDAIAPIAKVHDEKSYLLQADIFARGRWTVPSPPIPEFFEQPHVQVVPAVASKYPPGHAMLLTVGALVGFPPLVPLLLTGVTAALLFGLAMRLTNPLIALLTWTIWISAPIVLRFQPSYFSELTTTALLLGSWWALLEWRETRKTRWLLLMALGIGWGAITRPLTMLAFAIPIGVVVIRDVVRLRLWRDLGLAFAVGVAILGILPLWSARTTGDWRLSPIELYRRDYLPFDKMGFTVDTTPPRRTVSPVLKVTYDYFLSARRQQQLGSLPHIVADRALNLTIALFQGARLPLVPFAIIGLFFISGPLQFAALSALLLFIMHLPYAHWAPWTVYYLETAPLVGIVTAIGLWRAAQLLLSDERQVRLAVLLLTAVIVVFAVPSIDHWRRDHRGRAAFYRRFASEVKKLPPHSIVFVQYTPRTAQHIDVVFNSANLDKEPVWIVHDLGARNAELRARVPDRTSYDFDEDVLVQRLRR